MAAKAKSKSRTTTRSAKAEVSATQSRKRTSSSVSESTGSIITSKKAKVAPNVSISSGTSVSSSTSVKPSISEKSNSVITESKNISVRSATIANSPSVKTVSVKKSKPVPKPSAKPIKKSSASISSSSKSSTKSVATNGSISEKTKPTTKKALPIKKKVSVKKPAPKSMASTKRPPRGKAATTAANFRAENVSAIQENALKQQETLRAQMHAGRSARALARGLPLVDDKGSDTEDSSTASDAEPATSISSQSQSSKSSFHGNSVSSHAVKSQSSTAVKSQSMKISKDISKSTVSTKISPVLSSFATSSVGVSSQSSSAANNSVSSKGSPSLSFTCKAIPDITVRDESGAEHNLADFTSNTGVVLFAYPKANTPGCSTQANSYSENYDKFEDLGYTVYGISFDTPKAQNVWKSKQNYKMKLLCSGKNEGENALRALGANAVGDKIDRSHWIFAKGGKLLNQMIGTKPATCMSQALEVAEDNPQV